MKNKSIKLTHQHPRTCTTHTTNYRKTLKVLANENLLRFWKLLLSDFTIAGLQSFGMWKIESLTNALISRYKLQSLFRDFSEGKVSLPNNFRENWFRSVRRLNCARNRRKTRAICNYGCGTSLLKIFAANLKIVQFLVKLVKPGDTVMPYNAVMAISPSKLLHNAINSCIHSNKTQINFRLCMFTLECNALRLQQFPISIKVSASLLLDFRVFIFFGVRIQIFRRTKDCFA